MTERESADAHEGSEGHPSRVTDGRPSAGGDPDRMAASAARAAGFLKSLGHEQRLLILCHLVTAQKSVRELEEALGARQAAVSQQLARLRHEGLVTARRKGKTIYYGLADEKAQRMIGLLYELFCEGE